MNTPTSLAVLERVVQNGRKTTDFFVKLQKGLLWPAVELLIRLWARQGILCFRHAQGGPLADSPRLSGK